MSDLTTETSDDKGLANRREDYLATAARAVLGIAPLGSFLGELAGTIIPNQRLDRIGDFVLKLDKRVGHLEQERLRTEFADEHLTDLLEEALHQATRSLSDARREYFASLVANSLTAQDITRAESKHLLRILDQLNDVEVLWLRFYLDPVLNSDHDFRTRHRDVLSPIAPVMSSPPEVLDKATLQKSYKSHLSELGLLEARYNIKQTKNVSKLDVQGYEITSLGRLLLRQIGLSG